ncbi:MAG: ABC transporter permease [Pseudomonadota bacterium]
MFRLLYVELLKIRRSLALLMMFAIPMLVVVLNALILTKQHELHAISPKHWMQYWSGVTGIWSYFMLPLYIALVTGLLNGQEHKNQTWRLMLTLPVSQLDLYVVKAVLAWLFVVGATAVLIVGASMVVALIGVLGGTMEGSLAFSSWPVIAKVMLTCLPVLVVQHAVSWRFSNLVLPLAVGVVATMGITQIGSSSYWVYYPWTYSVMANMGSDPLMQQKALTLAAAVGLGLFGASAVWLGRRDVEN